MEAIPVSVRERVGVSSEVFVKHVMKGVWKESRVRRSRGADVCGR